ncbi:MAG: glycosyltransferase [Bacteroides sp.]|nr:glycosyltransferase [Bacteroides sp.]
MGLKRFSRALLKFMYFPSIDSHDVTVATDGRRKVNIDRIRAYLNYIYKDTGASCIACRNIEAIHYDLQIIIPVYNVEKYLRECLDSIFSQLPGLDYRVNVTIVNDGSTDSSAQIVEEYTDRENVTIIHKKNGGVSSARNAGLDAMNARFIMFVDSDDMLAPGSLKIILDAITKDDQLDVVQANFENFCGSQTLGVEKYVGLNGFPWGKIYRSSIFKNLKFPEGFLYEDTFIHLMINQYLDDKSKCIPDILFRYRQNESGLTWSNVGKPRNLDSLYITGSLLRDAAVLGMDMERIRLAFLHQCAMNYRRISSMKSTEINKAVFLYTAYVYEKYFQKQTIISDPRLASLDRTLRSLDYKEYLLAIHKLEFPD